MTNPYDDQALVAALSTYREIDEEIKALEAQLKEQRAIIENAVKAYDGKVHLRGLAAITTAAPSSTWSYDSKAIDKIRDQALRDGDIQTATALTAAMKETKRAGGIRITIESPV